MKAKVKINYDAINGIREVAIEALCKTADAIKTDLVNSQTMPFDTGELQNRNTYVDYKHKKIGKVRIVSDTPYARRLYFHPEYDFNQDKNAHAGGLWFKPYINGNKKKFAQNAFNRFMRSNKI
jgi:hypothetical protein